MINYILFFFPGNFLFLWIGWGYASRSIDLMERAITSPWLPYIWPAKLAIPVCVALSILQGLSEFTKCYYRWKLNANLWPAEVDGGGNAPTTTSESGAVDNGNKL
jgi:TRAP-type mannitol/chloroaromatic compound transport system permease small subunit